MYESCLEGGTFYIFCDSFNIVSYSYYKLRNDYRVFRTIHQNVAWKIDRQDNSYMTQNKLSVIDVFKWLHGHDDVINWKYFPRYWPFVRGIHRSPVNSPHKGQWRGALMISLICVWINCWVKNREAGDLGRRRGHYDVTIRTTTNQRVSMMRPHLLQNRSPAWFGRLNIILSAESFKDTTQK